MNYTEFIKENSTYNSRCPICKSSDLSSFLSDQIFKLRNTSLTDVEFIYSVIKCNACGLGFMDPMPHEKLSSLFYNTNYNCYIQKPGRESFYLDDIKSTLAKWDSDDRVLTKTISFVMSILIGRRFTHTLSKPMSMNKKVNFLDFGCGTGEFLFLLKRRGFKNLYGWDIGSNIELNSRLESTGINQLPEGFLDSDFMDNKFHLIRMEHVLEHTNDPIALLNKLKRKLTKEGQIVCTVPDFSSWSLRFDPKTCPLLHLPYHTWHYTLVNLRMICKLSGLRILSHKKIPVYAQFHKSIQKNSSQGLLKNLDKLFHPINQPFYAIFSDILGNGDFLTVTLKNMN